MTKPNDAFLDTSSPRKVFAEPATRKPRKERKTIDMAKVGRPSDFTQKLADEICAQLAEGKSLRTVCDLKGMPDKATVFRWLRTNDKFRDQYARAKEEASDALADEILDIADDGFNDWMEIEKGKGHTAVVLDREHVERSKLRIESRKWILAKMKPKKYGDKIDMTTNGKDLPAPIYGGKSVS